ncbi:MAG: hypothetical protein JSV49_08515 [Thermoplasmata archaeon]|nr:MAG: hypothetical protein JSV49_08515 [Thermoplasmata archaeon]
MKGGQGITLDPDLMKKLDKFRGDVPREEFLEKLLSQFSAQTEKGDENKGSEDKDKESNFGDQSESQKTPDEGNMEKIDAILSKVELFDELNSRIEELEQKNKDLESSLKTSRSESKPSVDKKQKKSGEDTNNHTDNMIETESGERVKTFKFSGEAVEEDKEGIIEEIHDEAYSDSYDMKEQDEIEGTEEEGYEFVFGCWYCNHTIEESELVCPHCGKQVDGQPSGEDWLQQIGEESGGVEAEEDLDDYDEDYYEETDEYYYENDDYDPSQNRAHYEYPYPNQVGGGSSFDYPHFQPSGVESPICPTCGGSTEYISRYDRWYCYKCATYIRGMYSPSSAGDNTYQHDRKKVMENILNRRHRRTAAGTGTNDKPLMYYGPYASTSAVTKISLIESEKPEGKKKLFRKE